MDRSFKPDFVLIRQNMRDAGEDYKSVVLALKFGGVPSVNSLESIYHFQVFPIESIFIDFTCLRASVFQSNQRSNIKSATNVAAVHTTWRNMPS